MAFRNPRLRRRFCMFVNFDAGLIGVSREARRNHCTEWALEGGPIHVPNPRTSGNPGIPNKPVAHKSVSFKQPESSMLEETAIVVIVAFLFIWIWKKY